MSTVTIENIKKKMESQFQPRFPPNGKLNAIAFFPSSHISRSLIWFIEVLSEHPKDFWHVFFDIFSSHGLRGGGISISFYPYGKLNAIAFFPTSHI